MTASARTRLPARLLSLASLALLLLSAASCTRAARPPDMAAINRAVSAAEATFQAMKARDYRGVWARLTSKSRTTVADETLAALAAQEKGGTSREALLADFRDGGPVARSYWDAFLARFDPDTALENSRWEAADTGPGKVLLLITYKTSENPAALRMVLEDGAWKFGLVETFWARRK